MKANFLFCVVTTATLLAAAAEVDHSWLRRVPAADRARANSFAGKQDAIEAGAKLFAQNCAKCHGADLQGKGRKPPLRSETIQNATDGELFWILKNGDLRHGMPSWNTTLPEPARWQIVAFLKSAQANEVSGKAESKP